MAESQYMTPPQAAEYLGVGVSTLAKWRLRGVGPQYRALSTKIIRYVRTDLDAWSASRTRASTTEARDG